MMIDVERDEVQDDGVSGLRGCEPDEVVSHVLHHQVQLVFVHEADGLLDHRAPGLSLDELNNIKPCDMITELGLK